MFHLVEIMVVGNNVRDNTLFLENIMNIVSHSVFYNINSKIIIRPAVQHSSPLDPKILSDQVVVPQHQMHF